MSKTPGVTNAPIQAPAWPSSRWNLEGRAASTASNIPLARHASMTCGSGLQNPCCTSRSAARNGAGCKSNESATLNMAVATPMPMDSNPAHSNGTAGRAVMRRHAWRMSSASMSGLLGRRSAGSAR